MKFNKTKNSVKNAAVFGTFTALNIGLGIAGLTVGAGVLLTAVSAVSIVLGAIWGVVSAVSTRRAIKAYKAKKQFKDGVLPEEAILNVQSQSKKIEKEDYKTGLKLRKEAIKHIKSENAVQMADNKNNSVQIKKQYKADKKTADAKTTYLNSKLDNKKSAIEIKSNRKAELKSIPKKATGYKLARGFSIAGATLGAILSLVSSAFLFNHFNEATTKSNELGSSKDEFITKQTKIDDSIGVAISGVSLAAAITGAVTAGAAKKRQKKYIGHWDYTTTNGKEEEQVKEPTENE